MNSNCKFCGHDNPEGANFCSECGAAFQLVCRFCEHSNPAGSKFCNQCGGQINLLPCPHCGAVRDVTAKTCYKCQGQLWGRRGEAPESTSPVNGDDGPLPGEFPQRLDGSAAAELEQPGEPEVESGAAALDSRATWRDMPLPGNYLSRIDNATTLSEIEEIFDQLSEGAPDAHENAVSAARPAKPDILRPPVPGTEADQPDGIDPPSMTADADRPDGLDIEPPAAELEEAVPRRKARMIIGGMILVVIGALGYYNYQQRSQGGALQPQSASVERRDRGGIDRDVAESNSTMLKTIPAREVLSEAAEERKKFISVETGAIPATAVQDAPESATATTPEPARTGAMEMENPARDEVPASSVTLAPKTPEATAAVVPLPASAATDEPLKDVPDGDAKAAAGLPQESLAPKPTSMLESARGAAAVEPKSVPEKTAATSADSGSGQPDGKTAGFREPTDMASRDKARTDTGSTASPMPTRVREKAKQETVSRRGSSTSAAVPEVKRAPAPARTAAPSAYPVQPAPELAPNRLAPPEDADQGRPGACRGSYLTALWTGCVGDVTLPDGRHYVGEFRDGLYHGHGTATLPDGETYVGNLRSGKRDGQGTATYTDGRKFVGEWKDDKAHGTGTATYADGRKYVGEFKQGRRDGQGTLTYPDGRKYVGAWKNDRYNGQGTESYPNGAKYSGEFRNGLYQGQGSYLYPDGSRYVGEFKDGRYQGQGTATFPDKSRYVGTFKDGHYDGRGTVTYADGFRYIGEWRGDKANGQGTAFFPDGRKYVGEWKDDKPDGNGTEYGPTGLILRTGVWKNGKFVGG